MGNESAIEKSSRRKKKHVAAISLSIFLLFRCQVASPVLVSSIITSRVSSLTTLCQRISTSHYFQQRKNNFKTTKKKKKNNKKKNRKKGKSLFPSCRQVQKSYSVRKQVHVTPLAVSDDTNASFQK